MTRLATILALAATVLTGCQAALPWQVAPKGDYRPGEILVQWRSAEAAEKSEAHARLGGDVLASTGALERLSVPEGSELEYCRRYGSEAAVAHAEPNYTVRTQEVKGSLRYARRVLFTPNDWALTAAPPLVPGQSTTWGLAAVNAPAAWDVTAGDPSVTVAVIDTGVDMAHEDLAANIDSADAINLVEPGREVDDDFGHGTHVAGIIAAVANNGIGTAGLAFKTRIMPIRVLGVDGTGSVYDTVAAIAHAVSHGAKVINMSLGSPDRSDIEAEAVEAAIAAGVVVVAAAGNEATEGNYQEYPAGYAGVIGVGAVGPDRQRAIFSNYNSNVTIAAPGVDIYSTMPTRFISGAGSGAPYAFLSGTSMAAPFVSAAAALVFAAHPGWTPAQVTARLQNTAQDLSVGNDIPGFDVYFGSGLLDAARAVAN